MTIILSQFHSSHQPEARLKRHHIISRQFLYSVLHNRGQWLVHWSHIKIVHLDQNPIPLPAYHELWDILNRPIKEFTKVQIKKMKSGMRETLLQEWEHTEKLIRNEFTKRNREVFWMVVPVANSLRPWPRSDDWLLRKFFCLEARMFRYDDSIYSTVIVRIKLKSQLKLIWVL